MSSRIHRIASDSVQPSHGTLVPFDPQARADSLRLAPPTPLIGREPELTRLAASVRSRTVRLLTLTGAGGVGKTRLAQAIATAVTGDFADGVVYVSLASVADPTLVPATIARALGVRESGERPLLDQLEIALRGRDLLLVLDTFERLLPAADLVGGLVAACPRLTVIVTSRARLKLAAEHAVAILPLALPDAPPAADGKAAHDAFLTKMEKAAAVQLFVARARAFVPDFALTPENASDVAEICRRLDGLPLAIELAAAWTRLMTPAALRGRLEPRLALLTGGPRDLPARQRTMREAIQWSYDLLTSMEQALFRRLSVFAGGFTLEAAARVADVEAGDAPILDLVAALADQSLLGRAASGSFESEPGVPRFAMLDTIREFGFEQLAATDEAPAVRARHAAWCVALTEASEPELQGPDQRTHLDRLESDLDNVRAALAWTLAQGDTSSALRIAGALAFFWIKHGHLAEGRTWLERALDQDASAATGPTRASDSVRAKALIAAGSLAFVQGDYDASVARHRAALAASRKANNRREEAHALTGLGGSLVIAGRPSEGTPLLQAALRLYDRRPDQSWHGIALGQLGLALFQGGEPDGARALVETAVATLRACGDWWGACFALTLLGSVNIAAGDLDRARNAFTECLDIAWANGEAGFIAEPLFGLGIVAVFAGQPGRASRLLGGAASVAEAIGFTPLRHTQAMIDQATAAAKSALGPAAFAEARSAGRALSAAEVVAEALDQKVEHPIGHLTPRERAVLRLLTESKSDKEIGAALFISHRTAMWHVRHILRKLGVATRAEAATYAMRHGLN